MTIGDDFEPAADVLRSWALDEDLKHRVMASPSLSAVARRVAGRYIAGQMTGDAIQAAQASVERGHLVSIEYGGESVRSADLARSEAAVFFDVAAKAVAARLPTTISFDLSHLGALVDPDLARRHVRGIADVVEPVGAPLMISAEGSDRVDLVHDLYTQLVREVPDIGITLQARLHRSPSDLEKLLDLPGRIRLVKGAFLEPESTAYPRNSPQLTEAYLSLVRRIVRAGHPLSIATHDADLVQSLIAEHGNDLKSDSIEFEMLLGLGTELLDGLRADRYATREYLVFGDEWWLYVLNRIAEQPQRVFAALADLGEMSEKADANG